MTEVTLETVLSRLDQIDGRLERLDGRLDQIDERLTRVEQHATVTSMQFMGRQFETLQNDLRVTAAIVQRLDGNIAGLVNENRELYAGHVKLRGRVDALEDRQ
jgi:hypothetical protein